MQRVSLGFATVLADAGRAPRPPSAQDEPEHARSTSTASPCSTWATRRPERSRLVRRRAARPSCRRSRTSSARTAASIAGVRQSRFGVKAWTPTDDRRAQDDLRVRALRHRRGRRARRRSGSATPRASWAIGARGRPGARSWIPTSSPTRSSTGVRTAWSSSATSSCAGCRSRRRQRSSWSRWSGPGASRRRGVYADRIELHGRERPVPGSPTSPRSSG